MTTDETPTQVVPNWISNCSAGPGAESDQAIGFSLFVWFFGGQDAFTELPSVDSSGTLSFRPAHNVRESGAIAVTIFDGGGTDNGGSDRTTLMIHWDIGKIHPWRNSTNYNDVNDDTFVAADDVIDVINHINAAGSGQLPDRTTITKPYYDTDGDDQCTASDVIKIINYINAHPGAQAGEGNDHLTTPAVDVGLDEMLMLLATDTGQNHRARRGPVHR